MEQGLKWAYMSHGTLQPLLMWWVLNAIKEAFSDGRLALYTFVADS
jgi:hypothetical protein